MLGLLTCKRLLSQQWGGSQVPVLLVALDDASGNECQPGALAQVWCNDAMHRLTGPGRRPVMQQFLDPNPLLAARVRDQLRKLGKGDEVVAAQMMQGVFNNPGALNYDSFYVTLIPCYLEASDFAVRGSLSHDGKTGSRRLTWLPPCFCGAAPPKIGRNDSADIPSKGLRSVPALLLQFSSSAPGDLLRTAPSAPSSLIRHCSLLLQQPTRPSQLLRSRSANLALIKGPHENHLSLPPTPGASNSNGARALLVGQTQNAAGNFPASSLQAGGLLLGQFRPSGRFLAAVTSATTSGRGARRSCLGTQAANRSDATGGRSLRERRNSLALAAVPLAVTIFALPDGTVLHQNAASVDYYGVRTAIVPSSCAPHGAVLPRSVRPNAMPPLQELLESGSSAALRPCGAYGGGGDEVDGKGTGGVKAAAAAPPAASVSAAEAACSKGAAGAAQHAAAGGGGDGSGSGPQDAAVAPTVGAAAAAAAGGCTRAEGHSVGCASNTNLALLSTSSNVHLVLPMGGSTAGADRANHLGGFSVEQGQAPDQTAAPTGAAAGGAPAVSNQTAVELSPGAGAATAAAPGHHLGERGDCADGGSVLAVAVVPDVDVLRQLFALEQVKLERMLAAVATEGEVWQGIVRVPYTLYAEEDDGHQYQYQETELEEEVGQGAGGNGAGVTTSRQRRLGGTRGCGPDSSPNANADRGTSDDEDGDGGNLDIMGSIAVDIQEAMSMVTASLNQRIRDGTHALSAVPSTTAVLSTTAVPSVTTAPTAAQSEVLSESRGAGGPVAAAGAAPQQQRLLSSALKQQLEHLQQRRRQEQEQEKEGAETPRPSTEPPPLSARRQRDYESEDGQQDGDREGDTAVQEVAAAVSSWAPAPHGGEASSTQGSRAEEQPNTLAKVSQAERRSHPRSPGETTGGGAGAASLSSSSVTAGAGEEGEGEGEGGGSAGGDDGGVLSLGPFSAGPVTQRKPRSRTEPTTATAEITTAEITTAEVHLRTSGATIMTTLGIITADLAVHRQDTGLSTTPVAGIGTGSEPGRAKHSRRRPHRSASAFSLHFNRLLGKSNSVNASLFQGPSSDRDSSTVTVTDGRECTQGHQDLQGFAEARDVGSFRAAKSHRSGKQQRRLHCFPSTPAPAHVVDQSQDQGQGQTQGPRSSCSISVPATSPPAQRSSRPTLGRLLASLSRSLNLPASANTTVATVAPLAIASSTSASSSTFMGLYGSMSPDDGVRRMSWVRNSMRSDGSQLEVTASALTSAIATAAASAAGNAALPLMDVDPNCCSAKADATAVPVEAHTIATRAASAAAGAAKQMALAASPRPQHLMPQTAPDANGQPPPPLSADAAPPPAMVPDETGMGAGTAGTAMGASTGTATGTSTGACLSRERAVSFTSSRRVPLSRCLSMDTIAAPMVGSGGGGASITFPTVPEESASGVQSSEGQLSRKPTSADLDVCGVPLAGKEVSKAAQKLGLLSRFLSYTVDSRLRRRGAADGRGGGARGSSTAAAGSGTRAGRRRGLDRGGAGMGGSGESTCSAGFVDDPRLVALSPRLTMPSTPVEMTQGVRSGRRQGGEFATGPSLVFDDETAVQRSAHSCMVASRDEYGRHRSGVAPYSSGGGGGIQRLAQAAAAAVNGQGFNPCTTMPSILSSPPNRNPVTRRQSMQQRRSFHTFNGLATSTWQVLMVSSEVDVSGTAQAGTDAMALTANPYTAANVVRQSGSHDLTAAPQLSLSRRGSAGSMPPHHLSPQAVGGPCCGPENVDDMYGSMGNGDPSFVSSIAFHVEEEVECATLLGQSEDSQQQQQQQGAGAPGPDSASNCEGGSDAVAVAGRDAAPDAAGLWDKRQTAQEPDGQGQGQWQGQARFGARELAPPSRTPSPAMVARSVSEDDPEGLSLLALLTEYEDVQVAEGPEDLLSPLNGPSSTGREDATGPNSLQSPSLMQPRPQPPAQYGNESSQPPSQYGNESSQPSARWGARSHSARTVLGPLAAGSSDQARATSYAAQGWSCSRAGTAGAFAGQLPPSGTVGLAPSLGTSAGSSSAAVSAVGVGAGIGATSQLPSQSQNQLSSSSAWARPQSSRVLAFASSLRTAPQQLAGPSPSPMTSTATLPQQQQSQPPLPQTTSFGPSSCSIATSGGLVSAGRPRTQTGFQRSSQVPAPVSAMKGCRKSRSSLALGEMLHLQQQQLSEPSSQAFNSTVPCTMYGGGSTETAAPMGTTSALAAPDVAPAGAAGSEDLAAQTENAGPGGGGGAAAPVGVMAAAASAASAAAVGPRESAFSQQPSRVGSFLRIGSSALSKTSLMTGQSPELSGVSPSPAATSALTPTPKGDPSGGQLPDAADAAAFGAAGDMGGAASTMPAVQPSPTEILGRRPPMQECWHEVCATSVLDPATGALALVLVQQDVTEKVIAERHVHQVAEVEHRLLEQIFPRHVLQYITEESVAPSVVPSSVGTLMGGAAPGSLAAYGSACQTPGPGDSWRPQIRDCNRLATWHSKVTVLFADIQGFTPMCKVLPPRVVMAFLNTLFTRFDAMLDYYRVYKVETIGDCYMVAGGLIREDEDGMAAVQGQVDPYQAANVFAFARAMLRAASCVRLPTTGQPVKVRVGIHTGPVVSGVVGTRMPRFCLFGDTVNTASRMESTGVPGAIHASEDTYCMLKSESGWASTGGIEVKGKGLMRTYLWSQPTPPSPATTTTATASIAATPLSPCLEPRPLPARCSVWSITSDTGAITADDAAAGTSRNSVVRHVSNPAAAPRAVVDRGADAKGTEPKGPTMPDAEALIKQMEVLARSVAVDGGGDRDRGGGGGGVGAELRGRAEAVPDKGPDVSTGFAAPAASVAAEAGAATAATAAPLACRNPPVSGPSMRVAPEGDVAQSSKPALSSPELLAPQPVLPQPVRAAATAGRSAPASPGKAPEPQWRGHHDAKPATTSTSLISEAATASAARPSPEPEPAVTIDPNVLALSQLLNGAYLASRRLASGTAGVASQSLSSSANMLIELLGQRPSAAGRTSSAQLQHQTSPAQPPVQASIRSSSSNFLMECHASLTEWYRQTSS